MTQRQKGTPEGGNEDFSTGFQIPRSRSAGAQAALQAQHQEETEQDAREGRTLRRGRGGLVCICDDPGCRIGPMKARSEGA